MSLSVGCKKCSRPDFAKLAAEKTSVAVITYSRGERRGRHDLAALLIAGLYVALSRRAGKLRVLIG
jgi:hypothetical protein